MSKNVAIGVGVAVVVVGLATYFVFFAGGQTYTVNIDTSCKVNPDPVTISPHDQVTWVAKDQAYNVVFAASPFTNITSGTPFPVPQVPPNQPTSSGGVSASVELKCVLGCKLTYKYSVTGRTDGCVYDPAVIIEK
jgi:plastocyanin